jgi:acyl-CoA hydrolase
MEYSDGDRAPRPVSASKSEMAEVVLPNDTNPLGALLGGRLMHLIDIAAAMAAHRHSRSYVVTASMDHIDFLAPVHVGELLLLKSAVNRAFNTSMEVGVKAYVENYISARGFRIRDFRRCGPPHEQAAGAAGAARVRRREAPL